MVSTGANDPFGGWRVAIFEALMMDFSSRDSIALSSMAGDSLYMRGKM